MQTQTLRRRLTSLTGALGLVLLAGAAFAGALEDAQALRDAGKFEEALPKFEQAVSSDPASADAALGLSEVLAGLGRYEDAIRAASAGIKANKDHLALLLARARAQMLMAEQLNTDGADSDQILGTVAEADFSIKAALRVDEKNADARVLKARVYQFQGGASSSAARIELEGVLEDHPDHYDANWALAKYHFNQGAAKQKDAEAAAPHWEKAEAGFRKCSKLDPTSGMAHWELANAMAWQRKNASDVAAEYALAAELLPGNERVLGQLYKWSGTNKKSRVTKFEAVAAKRPGEPSPITYLAWARYEAGDADGAIKTLKASEKTMKGQPALAFERGQIEMLRGNADAAFDAYTTSIGASDALNRNIYLQINDKAYRGAGFTPGQREKLWNALWSKWPEQFEAPNAAGLWYRDTAKDYKKSAAWYPRAVEANPDSPQVLNDTALILDQYLGEHEMAEPYYRRAVAAGAEQGRDYTDTSNYDNIGYRDALNNFGNMLMKQERWKDLKEFCENDVPEGHGRRGFWLKAAEKGGA